MLKNRLHRDLIYHEYDYKIIMIIFYHIYHGNAFIIFAVL